MIRRKKLTIFTDAKENTTVAELKKMIEGITKTLPEDQQLFNYNNEVGQSPPGEIKFYKPHYCKTCWFKMHFLHVCVFQAHVPCTVSCM